MSDCPPSSKNVISTVVAIVGLVSLVVGIMLSVLGSGSIRERVGRLEGRLDTLSEVVATRLDTMAESILRIESRLERSLQYQGKD